MSSEGLAVRRTFCPGKLKRISRTLHNYLTKDNSQLSIGGTRGAKGRVLETDGYWKPTLDIYFIKICSCRPEI